MKRFTHPVCRRSCPLWGCVTLNVYNKIFSVLIYPRNGEQFPPCAAHALHTLRSNWATDDDETDWGTFCALSAQAVVFCWTVDH